MSSAPRRRRTHSPAFKANLVRQCQQPGVSISAIALANQINANLLRKWIKSSILPSPIPIPSTHAIPPQLVPVHIDESSLPAPSPSPIRIQIQHGKTNLHIEWPIGSAATCAQWLQEWLR